MTCEKCLCDGSFLRKLIELDLGLINDNEIQSVAFYWRLVTWN
jgi:hypothetical protein